MYKDTIFIISNYAAYTNLRAVASKHNKRDNIMQTFQNIHLYVEMWGELFSLIGILIVFLTRYFDKVGMR